MRREAEEVRGVEGPGGGAEGERNENEDSCLADLADLAEDEEREEAEEKEGQKVAVVPSAEDEKHEGPPDDFRVEVYRLALHMHCKKPREVTKTVMEMILRLRMDGYNVNQVHTDQGQEEGNCDFQDGG